MGRTGGNTKERLIETVTELIWQSSYGSVSVDDICKTADVKKGSFYHYFPSKAALAVAAIEACYEEWRPIMDSTFSPSIPPVERFEKMAALIYDEQVEALEKYGHVCGCPLASLGSELAGQEDEICEKVDEVFSKTDKYYENALRDMVSEGLLSEDTDVEAVAAKIHSFLLGQVMIARIQNDLEPLKRDLKVGLFRIIGIEEKVLEGV